MAGREQDVRARDGWRSADRGEEQLVDRDAAAWGSAPCTQGAGQSAAQSFAVQAAVAVPALPKPAASGWLLEAQMLEVQMPEGHSVAQREQQEPARAAQEEARQLMRA